LETNIKCLEEEVKYIPGKGSTYLESKGHFESIQKEKEKEKDVSNTQDTSFIQKSTPIPIVWNDSIKFIFGSSTSSTPQITFGSNSSTSSNSNTKPLFTFGSNSSTSSSSTPQITFGSNSNTSSSSTPQITFGSSSSTSSSV
jgi:hypothetical protein